MVAPAIAVAIRAAITKLAGKAVVQKTSSHVAVKLGKQVLFTSQSEAVAGQFAKGFNMGMKGKQMVGHNLLSEQMGYHKAQEVTAQLKTSVQKRVGQELQKDFFGGSDDSQRGGVRAITRVKSNNFRSTGRGNRFNASNVKGPNYSNQNVKAPNFSNSKGGNVKYGNAPKFSNIKFSNFSLKNNTKYSNAKFSNIKFGQAPKFSNAKYSNANYSNQRRSK